MSSQNQLTRVLKVVALQKPLSTLTRQLDLNAECIERISHIEGSGRPAVFAADDSSSAIRSPPFVCNLIQDSLRVDTPVRAQLLDKLKERRHRLLEAIGSWQLSGLGASLGGTKT